MKYDIEAKFVQLGGIRAMDRMSEDEISRFEARIGHRLPETYRHFLSEYGAADFDETVLIEPTIRLPAHIATSGKLHLSHFFGSSSGNQSIEETWDLIRDQIPSTMIPIADDGLGNDVCLVVAGAARGKVYYRDHETAPDWDARTTEHDPNVPIEAQFQNIHLLADSFEDFLMSLQKVEE